MTDERLNPLNGPAHETGEALPSRRNMVGAALVGIGGLALTTSTPSLAQQQTANPGPVPPMHFPSIGSANAAARAGYLAPGRHVIIDPGDGIGFTAIVETYDNPRNPEGGAVRPTITGTGGVHFLNTDGPTDTMLKAGNAGLTLRSARANGTTSFTAVQHGTPYKLNEAPSELRAAVGDPVADPKAPMQLVAFGTHYDTDGVYRGRIGTRLKNGASKHLDFYTHVAGCNAIHIMGPRRGGSGRNNILMAPSQTHFMTRKDWRASKQTGLVAWKPGAMVSRGEKRTLSYVDWICLECITGGMTGTVEPSDPPPVGQIVRDGGAVWKVSSRIRSRTGGEPRASLFIDEEGRVGIGTMEPKSALDVDVTASFRRGMRFSGAGEASATLTDILTKKAVFDFGNIGPQAAGEGAVRMPGAEVLDVVQVAPSPSAARSGVTFSGYVNDAGDVRVQAHNYSRETIFLGSHTMRVMVTKAD